MKMMNHLNSPNHPSHWLCKNSFLRSPGHFKFQIMNLKTLGREIGKEWEKQRERERHRYIACMMCVHAGMGRM